MPAEASAPQNTPRQEALRIRTLRPAKPAIDPWHPLDVVLESERQVAGSEARVLTVFLAGSECPFTCVFCDLWRYTTDEPTPDGAIPAQIAEGIERFASEIDATTHIKLYNASNFFEKKAVPSADDARIVEHVGRFAKVIVECHPRLVNRRCLDFAKQLDGTLQVAMGLETVHPVAQPKLGKQATLDDFRRAAELLIENDCEWRAFVLLGAPFVPAEESVEWVERSVRFARDHGACHVTLIPTRGGNGEMERLADHGDFAAPTLGDLEDVLDRCLPLQDSTVVTVDTWDLEPLADCSSCRDARIARLEKINRTGKAEARVTCACRNA